MTPSATRGRRPGRRWPTVALAAGLLLATPVAGGCWIEPAHRAEQEARETDRAELRSEIRRLLDRSAAAWNRGDLDGFLDDYRRSDSTTYIGSSGLRQGYEAIRQRYAPLFEAGAVRDSLRFEGLRVRRLAEGLALATARYVLHRGDVTTSTGPFTLVLEDVDGAWKIVHDHSSTYEEGAPATEAPADGGRGREAARPAGDRAGG